MKNVQNNNAAVNKERIPVYLYPDTLKKIGETMSIANCKSRSDFLENAARFYSEYLKSLHCEEFLSQALMSALRGTLNDSEGRMARLLFKLAVEISMMMNIIAATADIDEATLEKLRAKCVNDVKKSRGSITFDDAVRYQNS